MRRSILGIIAIIVVAGCFPIELDVSSDGRILIPREEGFFTLDPATNTVAKVQAVPGSKPIFARFSPDGKQILTVAEGGGGGMFGAMGGAQVFSVVTVADGSSRSVFSGSNCTYTVWSPNGQQISLTRRADNKVAPLNEPLAELHVVNVKDGTTKRVASNVGILQRWFPDSKSVLAFQIDRKDTKDNLYRGSLVAVDVASGESKPLARVAGSKTTFFDLSPDGTKVLFTARAAGKPGAELTPEKEAKLFELDVTSGAVRPVGEKVKFAMYSPDGKRVLLGTDEKNSMVTLKVADAAVANPQDVAPRAAAKISGGMGSDTDIYPGWVDNDTIYYLSKTAVYGTAGENLALMLVGADGTNRRNLQAVIDTAAVKSAK